MLLSFEHTVCLSGPWAGKQKTTVLSLLQPKSACPDTLTHKALPTNWTTSPKERRPMKRKKRTFDHSSPAKGTTRNALRERAEKDGLSLWSTGSFGCTRLHARQRMSGQDHRASREVPFRTKTHSRNRDSLACRQQKTRLLRGGHALLSSQRRLRVIPLQIHMCVRTRACWNPSAWPKQ